MNIKVREVEFKLLHEGALYWPEKRILAIADLHLGKAQTFLKRGFWLPPRAHSEDLTQITRLVEALNPSEILFLGDFVHSSWGISEDLVQEFQQWLDKTKQNVSIILGNHDRLLKKWPKEWDRAQRILKWEESEFVFQHEEPENFDSNKFFWVGHLHPKVRISQGPEYWRLSCFLVSNSLGILPAFCSLSGGYDVRPSKKHKIFAPMPGTDKFVVF